MARPRKDTKQVAAPVPAAAPLPPPVAQPQLLPQPLLPDDRSDQVVLSRTEFITVRDSIYSRLQTLQELLKSFSADYVRQSNLLLGEPTSIDEHASSGAQALASLDHAMLGFAPHPSALPAPVEEKKERKKRQHDPNAPKRPLTPYFLYMQTARPIIAADLGTEAPKGAVQDEGQRRWASMTPQEKTAWNNAYQFNLRLYHARVHSYKAGNSQARAMSDEDALAYADVNGIPQPPLTGDPNEGAVPDDQDGITEQLQMTAPVAAAAVPEEAVNNVKTPKAKATRKRKSTAAATAVDGEEGEASAAKTATPASPEKKRKRQSKAAEIATEEPKKSARKKKST